MEPIDQNQLVKGAERSIQECLNMGETAYKEYGLITATLAQACATLALVKLLDSVYADGALRVVQVRY